MLPCSRHAGDSVVATPSCGEEPPMSDIGQSLKRLCDAFNAHDLDRIMSLFADDCVLEMPRGSQPWGSRFEGKDNVRQALAGRFEGLPDVNYGNEQHFIDNSRSEERSVGKACVRTCRSRWEQSHKKK